MVVNPGVSSLLSKQQYEQFFPHHDRLYSYEAFIQAAASFPLFAGEGLRRCVSGNWLLFFANAAHETTNGGPGAKGGEYAWGLYYTEEQGCSGGRCAVYNTGGTSPYHPAPGKSYYGRGPLQLSYAYNYGLAGAQLGLPLLEKPELVSHDGVIAFPRRPLVLDDTTSPKTFLSRRHLRKMDTRCNRPDSKTASRLWDDHQYHQRRCGMQQQERGDQIEPRRPHRLLQAPGRFAAGFRGSRL